MGAVPVESLFHESFLWLAPLLKSGCGRLVPKMSLSFIHYVHPLLLRRCRSSQLKLALISLALESGLPSASPQQIDCSGSDATIDQRFVSHKIPMLKYNPNAMVLGGGTLGVIRL